MLIYLAARYSKREELKSHRDTLNMLGHEVTSRWLDFEDENPHAFDFVETEDHSGHAAPAMREKVAEMDVEDVLRSDGIILFTSELGRRGGMFVEWGLAVAKRVYQSSTPLASPRPLMRLIVAGPRINVFQNFPGALSYSDFNEVLDNEREWAVS